ncbi:MAG: ABC transporter permease [Clostridiales bacterium]|nr:ABC transporter permease [Clostridiales bacterium]
MSALKKMFSLQYEVIQNRKLIWSLSKNDFKTRFAGSYLGIIWAFVQPIVTVLVYWFVFEKGLKANGINTKEGIEIQFVLWFVAALVPWFFFAEAWGNATNALLEYSYLVKKVVFKISILPIVKIISALFVHLFFVSFIILLYVCYGYYPDLYYLQIIYYSLCMFILALGLSYITSALVVFFKDLNQIISIILQVGMWLTPIMWNIDGIGLSETVKNLFKLNPMYYVTLGYRDTFINKVWFFEHPFQTLYFWIFTIVVFVLGTFIFKRLKVHFADVL